MKPKTDTRRALPMLALVLTSSLLLTACGKSSALEVRPAEPLPPPKVSVPAFLRQCPPRPSWSASPPKTCEPVRPQSNTGTGRTSGR